MDTNNIKLPDEHLAQAFTKQYSRPLTNILMACPLETQERDSFADEGNRAPSGRLIRLVYPEVKARRPCEGTPSNAVTLLNSYEGEPNTSNPLSSTHNP